MSRKQAFERRVEEQLKQMSIEIQRLLDQVDEAGADVEGEILLAIEEVCDRWTDAERERNRVRTADEDSWEHLRARLEAALHDLRSAIEPMAVRLRKAGPATASPAVSVASVASSTPAVLARDVPMKA